MWLRKENKNSKAELDFIVPIKSTTTTVGVKRKKDTKESIEQVKT